MRNVIVTGGTRGIGLGIARRLCRSGYKVIVIARRESEAFRTAQEEFGSGGSNPLSFSPFDLSDIDSIPKLVSGLRKEHGAIYALVNNAGISFDGSLAFMPASQIQQLVLVNTVSPIILTRSLVRSMVADGEGRIINISSITAFSGYKGLSVYSATKAAAVGFTKSLAREVGPAGVTVNAIAPGFISTDLTEQMTMEQRQKVERRSALRRLTGVDDVAAAVHFLLSEDATNITGTVLTVDAGSTA